MTLSSPGCQPLPQAPLLVGKPLATTDERAEQIGPGRGIPIFGLDALSSAAYGPEAALSLLIPLGLLGLQYIVPISAAIVIIVKRVETIVCQKT